MRKLYFLLIFSLSLISTVDFAAPPKWEIIPKESTLTFTAIQNGAEVHGGFATITGDIAFDLKDYQHSDIHIVIPLDSLQSSFADLKTTLVSADWFDTKKFPNAVYDAKIFEKKTNGEFLAKGNLTLRDKTMPLVLTFTAEQKTPELGAVVGHAEIKRLIFGVGQGDWASTDEIKDLVRVDFKITARRVP